MEKILNFYFPYPKNVSEGFNFTDKVNFPIIPREFIPMQKN